MKRRFQLRDLERKAEQSRGEMNSPRARKDSEMSSRTGSGGGTGVGIEGRGETPTTPNKPRMTVRNPNLSPRRSSIMSTSSRKQSVFQSNASVALEQLTFRPVSVTCFGDFILAQLMSSSRTNYLAIWGPECHQCDAQELTVETAKVKFDLQSRDNRCSSAGHCPLDP